jgi:hypothetical protein
MFEAKSEDIRRFFDLLGAIFFPIVAGFMIWQDEFRWRPNYKFLFLLLIIALCLIIYLSFYRLVWHFVNTRFLFGYANFLFISILSVSTIALIFIAANILMSQTFAQLTFDLNRFLTKINLTGITIFYWATSLPMAFFWLLGILTAWKFSKKDFLT